MSRLVDRKDRGEIYVGPLDAPESITATHKVQNVFRLPFGIRRVSTDTYVVEPPMVPSAFREMRRNDPRYLAEITQSRTNTVQWLRKRG